MTDLENLQTRRSNILTELAAIDANAAGGLPNSTASGVDHVGYKDGLYRELEFIEKRIAAAEGPWQEESQGFV